MKSILIFLSLSLCFFSANAQHCDRAISWKAASYLKRSANSGAVSSTAEWRHYRNADWAQTNFDGQVTSMISLDNGLRLIHSTEGAKPIELAELALAIESPMWSAGKNMFPHIAIPCQLKEGENTPVSRQDLNVSHGSTNDLPKIYGNLRRQGMRVTYAIEIQRGRSDDQLDSWVGTWEFEANPKNFPMNYDVQGWRVYRGGEMQEQLRIGLHVSISEVLARY